MSDDAREEWVDWIFSLPRGDWTDPNLKWTDRPVTAWDEPEVAEP